MRGPGSSSSLPSGASENSEAETELATKEEEKPADNENEVVTDAYGFEVFGEVPEAGAETVTEAEAETELATEEEERPADNENSAESENKEPESEPKYDKDGNGLFDFF